MDFMRCISFNFKFNFELYQVMILLSGPKNKNTHIMLSL